MHNLRFNERDELKKIQRGIIMGCSYKRLNINNIWVWQQ